ncbi:MAG: VWA domain-containing protein [Acidobacteria bacterium]|jgi:Ca-activated chloride channel family protein|nr:VWA domain-containing protein [Acidobacteriota bacterium]
MKKYSIFLFIASLIFSACTTGSTNTEVASEPSLTYSSNSNMMMSSNSSTTSTELKKVDDFDQTSGERYAEIDENPFLETSRAPLSTFSVDVDTASYSNVRRYLNHGQMPPKNAVRIEELINYFEYDYPQPIGDLPFSVNTEVAACAWNSKNKIVSIGLQGRKVSLEDAPPSNLVFLVDVSGSMNQADRLPLVKQGLKFLAWQLSPKDRVAIVVYAGKSGLVLPSTRDEQKILDSLDNLEAGSSTNGGEGIHLAYKVALDNFLPDGNNRVVLATDGDFNVGLQSDDELVRLIEAKRQSGIFLSVLGFGTGNTNDLMMEKLADKGNGNYAYIDSQAEARKALGGQAAGTLLTIAKDVKIQVEFNPAKIAGYRLIGYENRLLANRDFKDDRKDAGDIGAGHSVTALYEIVPAGQTVESDGIDLKYSKTEVSQSNFSDELLTVRLRYKEPNYSESKLLTQGLLDEENSIENASANLRFASAVAGFGLILRDSRYKGNVNYKKINQLAQNSLGSDLKNYRRDFLDLVRKADVLGN